MNILKIIATIILLFFIYTGANAQYTTGVVRVYESPEINGAESGTITLGTTINDTKHNRKFYPIGAIIIMTHIDNLMIPTIITVGKNANNYDDIVSTSVAGTLVNKIKTLEMSPELGILPERTTIKVKIVSPAVGIVGTPTCKFKIIIYGFDKVK